MYKLLFLMILPVFLIGCAHVEPSEEWTSVQSSVAEKLDATALWERSEEDARLIALQTKALLSEGLTRREAVQIALMNNRHLQSELNEVGITVANFVEASLPRNPELDLEYRFPNGGGDEVLEGGLLFWIADLWVVPLRRRTAEMTKQANLLAVEQTIIQTAVTAMQAYDNTLYRQEDLEMASEAYEIHRDWGERAKVRYSNGLESDQEVYGQEALAAEFAIARAEAQRNLTQAKAFLVQVLNLSDQQAANLTLEGDIYDIPPIDWTQENAVKYAMDKRLDVQVAMLGIKGSKRAESLAKAMIFDNVGAGVSYDDDDPFEGSYTLGPMLSIELPIFEQNQPEISRAEYRARQALQSLQQIHAEIRQEVTDVLAEIEYRSEHARIYEGKLGNLRKQSVEFAEDQANIMRQDWEEYYMARAEAVESRRMYLDSLRHLRLNEAELNNVLLGGGLNPIIENRLINRMGALD